MNIAVADAGPLIHLAEIGCLPLLSIFDITNLYDVSSLFVTRAIVELAIEELRKNSGEGRL
ncbi:MAG: hypothetical protein L6435_08740 [Anaerolineae bacterium]|nr:hypothetical protein [Anaerolineae bacterium]